MLTAANLARQTRMHVHLRASMTGEQHTVVGIEQREVHL